MFKKVTLGKQVRRVCIVTGICRYYLGNFASAVMQMFGDCGVDGSLAPSPLSLRCLISLKRLWSKHKMIPLSKWKPVICFQCQEESTRRDSWIWGRACGKKALPFTLLPLNSLMNGRSGSVKNCCPTTAFLLAGKTLSCHSQPLKLSQPAVSVSQDTSILCVCVHCAPKCNYLHPFSTWGY